MAKKITKYAGKGGSFIPLGRFGAEELGNTVFEEAKDMFINPENSQPKNKAIFDKVNQYLNSGHASPKFIGKMLAFVKGKFEGDIKYSEKIIQNFLHLNNFDGLKDLMLGYKEALNEIVNYKDFEGKKINKNILFEVLRECANHKDKNSDDEYAVNLWKEFISDFDSINLRDTFIAWASKDKIDYANIECALGKFKGALNSCYLVEIISTLAGRSDVESDIVISLIDEFKDDLGDFEMTTIFKTLITNKNSSLTEIKASLEKFDKKIGQENIREIKDIINEQESYRSPNVQLNDSSSSSHSSISVDAIYKIKKH